MAISYFTVKFEEIWRKLPNTLVIKSVNLHTPVLFLQHRNHKLPSKAQPSACALGPISSCLWKALVVQRLSTQLITEMLAVEIHPAVLQEKDPIICSRKDYSLENLMVQFYTATCWRYEFESIPRYPTTTKQHEVHCFCNFSISLLHQQYFPCYLVIPIFIETYCGFP